MDPAALFESLVTDDQHVVWFDAGPDAVTGTSVLGMTSEASRVVTESVRDGTVRVRGTGGVASGDAVHPGGILDFLRADNASVGGFGDAAALVTGAEGLGWAGWLGYESGARAAGAPVAGARHADAALIFVDRAVVFDHDRRTASVLALESADPEAWRRQVEQAAARARQKTPRAVAANDAGAPVWRHADDAYLGLIEQCQSAIRRGDAYQLCLTNEVRVAGRFDPVRTWLALREASPTHNGGFVRIDGVCLVSASPEQFLTVSADGLVRTRPIKGTRPRGETVARDLALRGELEASEKERAENIMIVDLMRNDLGRVCAAGTVTVTELLAVESYAQVHQLVSTVQGRLAAGRTALDAVAACFPAGSMTGAPKLSAMRILHRLEAGARGPYAGCFGRFAIDGSATLSMVIRSIVIDAGEASVGAGGGITALSVPEEELAEMHLKARSLLAVLSAHADAPE